MRKQQRSAMSASLVAVIALGLAVVLPLQGAEPVTPKLTEKLDRLLREEMRAIQTAMGQIHTAMVMGQHETVARHAQQIHESFILSQSLTVQDRRDLKTAVPPGFIELDREFHELSADLAEAGRSRDTANQLRLYNRMTRNCIQCHARYVGDRFPGVNPIGNKDAASVKGDGGN